MNTQKIKIKWVKKARQWCKTTFTIVGEGLSYKEVQKQEWLDKKPNI